MNKYQEYKDAEEYYLQCLKNNNLESKQFRFVDYTIKIFNSIKITSFEFSQGSKIIETRKYTKEQVKPYKELDDIIKYLDFAELECWEAMNKCDNDGYGRSFELIKLELQKNIAFCKKIREIL